MWWNDSTVPHKSHFGHVRYAIIPPPPLVPVLTEEQRRQYMASTFEREAAAFRPLPYEKGVWAGVEFLVDFELKNFSLRVDNRSSAW